MVYEKFVLGNEPAVYEPNKFAELCFQAGAPNILTTSSQQLQMTDFQKNRRAYGVYASTCDVWLVETNSQSALRFIDIVNIRYLPPPRGNKPGR